MQKGHFYFVRCADDEFVVKMYVAKSTASLDSQSHQNSQQADLLNDRR